MQGSELVGIVSGMLLAPPDAAMYTSNETAYMQAYKMCMDNNAACLRVVEKMVKEVVAGTFGVAGAAVGSVETVVSSLPWVKEEVMKLYADGKPYAEVAAGCVVDPVGCAKKGVHNARNRVRREKKKQAKRVPVEPVVDASRAELAESYAARRVAENRLAARKAQAALGVFDDVVVQQVAVDVERNRAVKRAAAAAVESQKALSELSSVSPDSSVSQQEYANLRGKLEAWELRGVMMEEVAAAYAPPGSVKEVRARAPVEPAGTGADAFNTAAMREKLQRLSLGDSVDDVEDAFASGW